MNGSALYETTDLVEQYLLFHYGSADEILPYSFGPTDALNFATRVVTEGFDLAWLKSGARALDLGCAVGRSSFELSRWCDEVVGIDRSNAFIQAANTLKDSGSLEYRRVDEGPITTQLKARVPGGVMPQKVSFQVGDALEVVPGQSKFDLVLAANLLDRVSDPARLLKTFSERVISGGQLVISSPYTWLKDYTPKSAWLAQNDGDRRQTSLEGMKSILGGDFRLSEVKDLPFLIREHARKFQWSVAQVSRWVRE
ncbi:MAG: putative 4-mercaptohistidine N1-methyltransferase [Bdellovibrionota bacterium]